MHDDIRLERTNRRLAFALIALGGLGAGGLLAGFAQPGTPTQPHPDDAFVGMSIHDDTGFLYRMRADGSLERLSLERGRIAGGGTPAEWKPFPVGVGAP
ncbi:MAG: hypothetical protein DHS20C14_19530 [Phycisphaeraceae bacterium]|nr:MAG: hypothetical protein DHS20C14_19530 [Phycisphaeraceae bacterium]